MSNNTHYYLPYLRSGLGAQVSEEEMSEQSIIKQIKLQVGAEGQEKAPASMNIALYGPGDVLGFRESIVSRVHPKAHIGNFSPSLIPFIEFKEPDFLWRYSGKRFENKYWLPWLSLIILKNKDGEEAGEFMEQAQEDQELPKRIAVQDVSLLPDLKECWRWAHLHTVDRADMDKAALDRKLGAQADQFKCRLLCPRRLQAGVKYTAFVVPTYKLGWQLGMGLATEAQRTELTWETDGNSNSLQLPYYYSWEFRTGLRGDFEYLVKQLEFRTITGSGTRSVDASNPGYGLQGLNAEDTPFEGALAATNHADKHWLQVGGERAFQRKLGNLLNRRVTRENGKVVRRVVPPVYGKWHYGKYSDSFAVNLNNPSWIHQLNLDPRYRYAAGLGAQYVKDKQEELTHSAWVQLSEVKKANKAANLAKFGRGVSEVMHKRLSKVSAEKLVMLSLPLQNKVQVGAVETGARSLTVSAGKNWHQMADQNRVRWGQLRQVKVRKYISGKVAKTQGFKMSTDPPPGGGNAPGNEGQQRRRRQRKIPPGLVEKLGEELLQELQDGILRTTNPKRVIEKRYRRKLIHLRKQNQRSKGEQILPKDALRPLLWYPQFHVPTYRYLRDRSQDLLFPGLENVPQNTVGLLQSNPKFIEAYMVGLNHEMAAELRWREFPTDMRGSYFRKFWDSTIYSLDDEERQIFAGTYEAGNDSKKQAALAQAAPFRIQLEEQLRDLDFSYDDPIGQIDTLRRQAGRIDDPKDLQAIKLYEYAVEKWLLTREQDKDIEALDTWSIGTILGDHINLPNKGHSSDTSDNQPVILIRGDILKQFPNMLIYLTTKMTDQEGKVVPNYAMAAREFPTFEGNLPPDMVFLGFGIDFDESDQYFLVFEEPQMELQYGLDEMEVDEQGNAADDEVDANDPQASTNLAWQHFNANEDWEGFLDSLPPQNNNAGNSWDSPSDIAKFLTQKSVRIAIPLERFIQPKN